MLFCSKTQNAITPYSRNRYFPFPCPFTFSTSPLSTNSFNSSDALVDLKPVVLSTPVLPKTSSVPYFSNKTSICPTVLSDISGNISTRHLSISAFSAPNVRFFCFNVRFSKSNIRFFRYEELTIDMHRSIPKLIFSPSNRFHKNNSKHSIISWTPLVRLL